jgi:ribokinase
MAVVVFGSINMDLVVRAPRLPAPGETLTGRTFFTAPGGKGANQAVACARLGAPTHMIGRVGGDMFGETLREGLRVYGVNVDGVVIDGDQPSGVALIAVDDAAENFIVVVPGANGTIGPNMIARLDAALPGAGVLLLQLEIPLDAVLAAAPGARGHGATTILDPAPACPLPPELYAVTDILTPNETEAALLVGFPVRSTDDARRAAALQRRILD